MPFKSVPTLNGFMRRIIVTDEMKFQANLDFEKFILNLICATSKMLRKKKLRICNCDQSVLWIETTGTIVK